MPPRSRKTRARATRATPEREAPLRQGAAAAAAFGDKVTRRVGHLVDDGLKTARLVVEAATEPVLGAAERGVQTAYTVIEEYLARGRDAARRLDTAATNGASGEPAPGAPWAGWAGAWGPMAPVMSQAAGPWMQVMRMWTDSMTQFVPGGAQAVNQVMSAMMGGPRPATAHRVLVASRRPCTVTLVLDPGSDPQGLAAVPVNPAGATCGTVAFAVVDGQGTLRVTVDDAAPGGTYRGDVHDAAGTRRGELTVTVEAA